MHCIFCKQNSSDSVSSEHIIPESLGNIEHVLPRGIVCDKCNNYFARKVEKPVLDSDYFTQARFYNFLTNKRGRVPSLQNVMGPGGVHLGMGRDNNREIFIYPMDVKSESKFINHLQKREGGTLYIPVAPKFDSYLISRFLAKMALEILAFRVIAVSGWEDEVIYNTELDDLRNFARLGDLKNKWEFNERRIYDEQQRFPSATGDDYEVLHGFDLLYTEEDELFAIIVILGNEYAINLCNRKINGYKEWLEENNHKSPLYL